MDQQWKANDSFQIPAKNIPSWRTSFAVQSGVEKNILMTTWGGIGDQICAEPTLRFALEHFKGVKVTLASHIPEVFSHLKFHDVYDLNVDTPILDDYLPFETNSQASQWNLLYQFVSHNVTNCVDFPALCALRCQLPIESKPVVLRPPEPSLSRQDLHYVNKSRRGFVAVHAGRHWQSKTFPKWWWDAAIESIKSKGMTPILVGKEVADSQGCVDTITEGCIDMRNKTTLNELIWLLQQVPVLITSDSSPLHMAVSGSAWIGYIATAKHPDYITHWRRDLGRNPTWSWRMKNLGLGGYWDLQDYCPNTQEEKTIDKVDPHILESWLPDPKDIGVFCEEKMHDYLK